MTPKEKAEELIKKFYNPIFYIDLGPVILNDYKRLMAAKQCALIAVDEMINNGNSEPQIKRHIGNTEPNIIH